MRKILLVLPILYLILASYIVNAKTIHITKGHSDPIAIAINDFAIFGEIDSKISKKITNIISNDLSNSGMFKPISRVAFIEKKTGTNHTPLFASWQQINSSLIINGHVTRLPSNKLQVGFILWDSILERKLTSETFELPESLWKKVAHKISDKVYNKITGYEGYFSTRIAYVSETGKYLDRKTRLAIMDYDGANHEYLTDGTDLVLTPRFSPNGKELLYLSYKNAIPQVHILNLNNKKSKLIGDFRGMSFAPRFAPDGKYAVMSIAKDGETHIYEINLQTKTMKQLTKGASINTSPTYSPDGNKIAFNSDADRSRQVLVMNRDGSNKQRISFGSGSYAEPNWSSRNYLAFTKITSDYGFTIGVMRSENAGSERLIAQGYLVESPSWAKNGRVLAFTKGIRPKNEKDAQIRGLNRIYTIDFTGHNERIIPTPHDASSPDWSSNL